MIRALLAIALLLLALRPGLAQVQLPPPLAPSAPQGPSQLPPVLPGIQSPAAPATPPASARPENDPGRALDQMLTRTPQQQPARQQGLQANFFDDNFNFPGIPSALIRGNHDAIPDDGETRALVVSYLRVINELCGEQDTNLAMAALRYASREFREIQSNPMGPALNFLEGIARLSRSGDIAGYLESEARRTAIFRSEGISDARYLIAAIGCTGAAFNTFLSHYRQLVIARSRTGPGATDPARLAALMSPAYRLRNNIPDPAVMLRNQELARVFSQAEAACNTEYRDAAFCRCAIQALKGLTNSPEQLQTVTRSFNAVVALPIDLRALRSGIGTCARGG